MRNLSPQRRTAAICGACAAIIPSAALLMHGIHRNSVDFAGGLVIGLAITLSIGAFTMSRRNCA